MLVLYVRYCSAMLLDLCPKVLSPRNTKILSGRAMFYPFGGQMQGWKQHFGPRSGPSWPSWALLSYPEATAMVLGAKLGDLEGKLGYREVMLKLSWAMLCYVEAIGQIFFGHVVGFASWSASPQQDQDIEWVSASYVCSIWGQVGLPYGYVGAILGPTSAILGLRWRLYGIILNHVPSASSKETQRYTSETPPLALKAKRNQIKNSPKTQKFRQNANLHGSKGKT